MEYGGEWNVESGIWRRVEYGEWNMEESGVWRRVEYGKYELCPLVEYESESGVMQNTLSRILQGKISPKTKILPFH